MLGKFGKMMDDANESIKNAQQMQEKAKADQEAAAQPIDMSNPMWEPIEGITLDKYAKITALLEKKNVISSLG